MPLISLYRIVREIGLDARKIRSIGQLPRFVRNLGEWKKQGGSVTSLFPVLGDWFDQAGSANGAYFHQDMLVARRIFEAEPPRHVDVGSRIDGFVAHLAVFRKVDVLDIRPLQSSIHNVRFIQADLMNVPRDLQSSTESLSCLHALEHFGLGRYGDPIDPQGHLKGFGSLVSMLKPNATFYVSFPIGQPAVEFNAHRIFGCEEIMSWPGSELLEPKAFDFVDDDGTLHEKLPVDRIASHCAELNHGCGIYTFTRRP